MTGNFYFKMHNPKYGLAVGSDEYVYYPGEKLTRDVRGDEYGFPGYLALFARAPLPWYRDIHIATFRAGEHDAGLWLRLPTEEQIVQAIVTNQIDNLCTLG